MDLEILEDFQTESKEILKELEVIVERLESPGHADFKSDLAEFAQKIDRIMGAAKTLEMEEPSNLGLTRIGQIASLCKSLGYKAAETGTAKLIPVFAAFWADTLEVLGELIENLGDGVECGRIANEFSPILQRRLEWLAAKLQGQTSQQVGLDLKALLRDLGVGGSGKN